MGIITDSTLYLDSAREKVLVAEFKEDGNGVEQEVVPEGAAFLLARRGTVVTDEDARKYNLTGDPEQTMMSAASERERVESQLKMARARGAYSEAAVLQRDLDAIALRVEDEESKPAATPVGKSRGTAAAAATPRGGSRRGAAATQDPPADPPEDPPADPPKDGAGE